MDSHKDKTTLEIVSANTVIVIHENQICICKNLSITGVPRKLLN